MKYLRILCFLLVVVLQNGIFAIDFYSDGISTPYNTTCSKLNASKKKYLDPSEIAVTHEGIYCHINDMWVLSPSLYQDAQEIFVLATDEAFFTWKCPKCGYENGTFSRSCKNCSYKPVY